MADRFFVGSGTTGFHDSANWSLVSGGAGGASVPTTGDVAIFDANSGSCTSTGAVAVGGLTLGTSDGAYVGTFDAAAYAVAIGASGFKGTYGTSDSVPNGSGTWTLTGSFFMGGCRWGGSTGTIDMTSTGTVLQGGSGSANAPAYVRISADNVSWTNGTVLRHVTVSTGVTFSVTGTTSIVDWSGPCVVTVNGAVTGIGKIRADHGIDLSLGTTATFTLTEVACTRTATVGAGTYDTYFNHSMAYGSSICYTQTGNVQFTQANFYNGHSSANYQIDLLGNTLTISSGCTFWTQNAGNIVISNDLNNSSWQFNGDVTFTESSGGSVVWNAGSGGVTFGGTTSQTVSFSSGRTLDAVTVNKTTGGTLTLGDALKCDSFTGTAGVMDPNGQTIQTTSGCAWSSGFDFSTGADTMNGCTWEIGGNFTADGQECRGSATWEMKVTGTAVASGSGYVSYSDASTGTAITATNWTDGLNNSNWTFGAVSVDGINCGAAPHLALMGF